MNLSCFLDKNFARGFLPKSSTKRRFQSLNRALALRKGPLQTKTNRESYAIEPRETIYRGATTVLWGLDKAAIMS